MLGKSGRLAAVGAMLALLSAVTPAQGVRPAAAGKTVLLLRNGEAIEGKITRAGDLYYVVLPDGELRVKADEVELWCENFEEGYRRKRAAIQLGDVHDHLGLARWCLRHGLLGRAAEELADAIDADPKHPMIGLLQRRLKMAMQPPPEPAAHPRPADRPPSVDDLDRLVRDMPPGTVETFTRSIQPLLMNNCTAAGCHGPRSPTEFRLFRVPSGRPAGRRLTQRNLHATLQWVDRRQPAASKLLTEPVRPHGTAKTPIFTEHQVARYKRMVDWVCRVAEQKEPEVPASVDVGKANGSASANASEGKVTAGVLSQDAARARPAAPAGSPRGEASRPSRDQPVVKGDRHDPAGRPPKIKRGSQPRRFVPADPFDPEIFNRRFHLGK